MVSWNAREKKSGTVADLREGKIERGEDSLDRNDVEIERRNREREKTKNSNRAVELHMSDPNPGVPFNLFSHEKRLSPCPNQHSSN